MPRSMASHTLLNSSASSKARIPAMGVSASCSVCWEAVSEDAGDRSIAKLKCGHYFHLDCIGSAFNAKGRMQCPNCRQTEQGQWLYANGFLSHEDFVDDFTINEEVYMGTTNLQFTPTTWCPHQGSFIPFSFEESDDLSTSYMEPILNVRVGSRVCPYLALHSLSIGVPSPYMEDFFGMHSGHHRTNRRHNRQVGGFHSASQRSFGSQQSSATSASMPILYGGTSQSFNTENFSQTNNNGQQNFTFFVQNPQSFHSGLSQGSSLRNAEQGFDQLPTHVRSTQSSQNGYLGTEWIQQEMNHSSLHAASTGDSWTTEPSQSGTFMQTSNTLRRPGGMHWTAVDSQVDPWTAGIYASQPASSQWWAWVPHAAGHHDHQVANAMANAYPTEGQFYNAALFPRPTVTPATGFSEQHTEGTTWGFSGFH